MTIVEKVFVGDQIADVDQLLGVEGIDLRRALAHLLQTLFEAVEKCGRVNLLFFQHLFALALRSLGDVLLQCLQNLLPVEESQSLSGQFTRFGITGDDGDVSSGDTLFLEELGDLDH